MHRTTSIAAFVTLGWLAAAPAAPQAVVSTLARGIEPLAETTDVRCSRFASFQDEPKVVVGMKLEPGDLLASVTAGVDLELTCPNGSLLRFSGGFRVMVNAAAEGVDCAVNFLSGTLDVLTDQPTEVNAGGVVLGSEGTQYSVELARDAEGAAWTCLVYDGRVRWRTAAIAGRQLETGTRLSFAGGAAADREQVADRDLSNAARRYARFDLAKSRAAGRQVADPRSALRELSQLHYDVLARPADADRRVALAKKQIDYQIPAQATYNLNRAGVRTEEQLQRYQIDARVLRLPPPPVRDLPRN